MRDAKDNPDLAEVKAVLRRLQRLDQARDVVDPDAERSARQGGSDAEAQLEARGGIEIFERKRQAIVAAKRAARPRRGRFVRSLGAISLAIAALVALVVTGTVKLPILSERDAPTAVPRQEDAMGLLADARRLLYAGDVVLARKRLLEGKPETHAELAFMLAQSYDPNYLRTLVTTNGVPDRVEAEKWYRKWYELAVASGLEMDSGRLKRIINAMQ